MRTYDFVTVLLCDNMMYSNSNSIDFPVGGLQSVDDSFVSGWTRGGSGIVAASNARYGSYRYARTGKWLALPPPQKINLNYSLTR